MNIHALVIKVYNFVISRKIINSKNFFCRKVRVWLHSNICYSCDAKFGKRNPDIYFYLIRCPKNDIGFMGLYNFVVYHLKLAEQMKKVPVVDLKYYPNDYLMEDEQIGKENVWDFFFEQTYKLDDVYKSCNVYMCNGEFNPSLAETEDAEELLYSNKIITKYLKIKPNLMKKCSVKQRELNMTGERVLGIKCRGTDFVVTKPSKHQIVPDEKQTMDVIDEKIVDWGGFDLLYLATEDQTIYDELKKKYGNKLISAEEHLISSREIDNKWLGDYFINKRCGEKIVHMENYFISTWLLSQCDSIIAPVVGGTLSAMRMKGKYSNVYLFHLGAYE